jgi:hypothetical protein
MNKNQFDESTMVDDKNKDAQNEAVANDINLRKRSLTNSP